MVRGRRSEAVSGVWLRPSVQHNDENEITNQIDKKALRETQTLRALAVVWRAKIFRPAARGAGRPKFNHLEMVTTCTYIPSLVKIDARNFELSW